VGRGALRYREFRGLSKATVQAVLAEHNFTYSRARPTLIEIAARSWRFSLSNFFRRSPRSASSLTSQPKIGPTGCAELDDEIYEIGREARTAQVLADRIVAAQLNQAEHAAADAMIECECCFGDYTWEEIAACANAHFFCHGCLIRSVQENVYGQGNNLLDDKCSVRCLSSSAQPLCEESVPLDVLSMVLPEEIYFALQDRTASNSLETSGLNLIRCPFCSYAEVDELHPHQMRRTAAVAFGAVIFIPLSALSTPVLRLLFLGVLLITIHLAIWPQFLLNGTTIFTATNTTVVSSSSSCLSSYSTSPPSWLISRITRAIRKNSLIRRGTLFRCENPRCRRESCINCHKEWGPFHKCYEKEEDEARIYIEIAMADAVKRTVSFSVCPPYLTFYFAIGILFITSPSQRGFIIRGKQHYSFQLTSLTFSIFSAQSATFPLSNRMAVIN
jgi:hypothetical protein